MTRNRTAAAAALPLIALLFSACVSQQSYDAMVAENNQLKAQIAALQAQSSFVEAGDLLFAESDPNPFASCAPISGVSMYARNVCASALFFAFAGMCIDSTGPSSAVGTLSSMIGNWK